MTAKLVFESKLTYHVLRQEAGVECAPVISLQLELAAGPKIYASDASIVNDSSWSMRIHRRNQAELHEVLPAVTVSYVPGTNEPRCFIDVYQSPARYDATLEMFKGGYASEITIIVDDFSDQSDYSKRWDTNAQAHLIIKSICFEFPLPQHEA